MIHRLPSWVWGGAALLSGIAGMVNAVGLLGAFHHGVTHLSGSASALGVGLAQGRWGVALHMLVLLAVFVAGAALSSVIVRGSELELGHRYGVALLVESLLLSAAAVLLHQRLSGAAYLLSAAAGLQNAMASTYSGAIVRTTHVTGVFTDIGILLGNVLRGGGLELKKLSLMLTIGLGFSVGSLAGALGYGAWGYGALWGPAAMTGGAGVVYLLCRLGRRRRVGGQ
jgi:uncharacterized membrane protein YoaK (UPF0700 family)